MLNSKAVQEIVDTALEMFSCAGISLTLTEDGLCRSFNAGYADLDTKRPMTEDTVMPIASATKAFTAEAICILADQGKLELDAPVKRYLPDFRMYDTYAENHMMVRDLLCHRCGLPRHDLLWYVHEEYSTEKLLQILPTLQPFASFREHYQYVNLMYAVAGHLIEVVSGKPWERFLSEEIIAPIGMENVCFTVDDLQQQRNAALGYEYRRGENAFVRLPYKRMWGARAAGGIYASSSQMSKWVDLQLNSGKAGDRTVVSEKLIQECHTPQTIMGKQPILSLPGNDFESYGLGWMIQRCHGHKLVHHGGNIDGFSSMHFFLPEDALGASILTNTGGCSARDGVMFALIALCLGQDWRAAMEATKQAVDAALAEEDEKRAKLLLQDQPNVPQTFPNETLQGTYTHPGYGTLTIEAQNGALKMTIGAVQRELTHISQMIFEARFWEGLYIRFQFVTGLDGKISGCDVDFEPMLKVPIHFERK